MTAGTFLLQSRARLTEVVPTERLRHGKHVRPTPPPAPDEEEAGAEEAEGSVEVLGPPREILRARAAPPPSPLRGDTPQQTRPPPRCTHRGSARVARRLDLTRVEPF